LGFSSVLAMGLFEALVQIGALQAHIGEQAVVGIGEPGKRPPIGEPAGQPPVQHGDHGHVLFLCRF